MTDIQLNWSATAFIADMSMAGADLATDDDLETAVIVSLFTWRRALSDDPLPDFETGRMGWWGDSFSDIDRDRIGSRLWLLRREKLTQQTVNRAKEYAAEALAWMKEDKVATRVDIDAERQGLSTLAMAVTIWRQTGEKVRLDFNNVWESIQNG